MMDFHFLNPGNVGTGWDLVMATANIIAINIVLAGDNAVVIAIAVRRLPTRLRFRALLLGSLTAVLLRVVLTYFAAQMLEMKFIKLIGGCLILWIAVKLVVAEEDSEDDTREAINAIWKTIWIIVIADLTMSLDNVLAVAAASKGSAALLLFGLGLSIPLVVFASNYLSQIMDKYPIILLIGAAILGRVGGEMIMTEPVVKQGLHATTAIDYTVQVTAALGVVAVALMLRSWKTQRPRFKRVRSEDLNMRNR